MIFSHRVIAAHHLEKVRTWQAKWTQTGSFRLDQGINLWIFMVHSNNGRYDERVVIAR